MLKPDGDARGERFEINGRCDCGSFLDHAFYNSKTGSVIAVCDAGCETLITDFKMGKT